MNLSVSEEISFTSVALPLSQEDQARADIYALISHLLLAAPDASLLRGLAEIEKPASQNQETPLDRAWVKLVLAAGVTEADAVREEYSDLFISMGTPPLNPYASRYLTGFLNEKPLAMLRSELRQLGLGRAQGTGELEDHLGALCEVMRIMITGAQGAKRQSLERQKAFFIKHIAPWYGRFLADMKVLSDGRFYSVIADFIEAFFDIEMQAFEIPEDSDLEPEQV